MKKILFYALLLLLVAAQAQPLSPFKNAGGKSGYQNESLATVIPATFDDAGKFFGKIATVKKGEKWAIINQQGKLLSLFKYASPPDDLFFMNPFSEGMAIVRLQETGKPGEELFKSRLMRLMTDANSHFVMALGDRIKEDTAAKAIFYKSRTTLNADITTITDKGTDRLFMCKYDKEKNPLASDCREQIKEVFALLANKGNSSVTPAGHPYAMAIKTDTDKGLTFYWLVEKNTKRRVAVMIENSQLLELDIFGQKI